MSSLFKTFTWKTSRQFEFGTSHQLKLWNHSIFFYWPWDSFVVWALGLIQTNPFHIFLQWVILNLFQRTAFRTQGSSESNWKSLFHIIRTYKRGKVSSIVKPFKNRINSQLCSCLKGKARKGTEKMGCLIRFCSGPIITNLAAHPELIRVLLWLPDL